MDSRGKEHQLSHRQMSDTINIINIINITSNNSTSIGKLNNQKEMYNRPKKAISHRKWHSRYVHPDQVITPRTILDYGGVAEETPTEKRQILPTAFSRHATGAEINGGLAFDPADFSTGQFVFRANVKTGTPITAEASNVPGSLPAEIEHVKLSSKNEGTAVAQVGQRNLALAFRPKHIAPVEIFVQSQDQAEVKKRKREDDEQNDGTSFVFRLKKD